MFSPSESDDSYKDRCKMFKSIFDASLNVNNADDLQKKVTRFIHVEETKDSIVGRGVSKSERIKNLRNACTNILKVYASAEGKAKIKEKANENKMAAMKTNPTVTSGNHYQVVQAWPVLAAPIPAVPQIDKPLKTGKKKAKVMTAAISSKSSLSKGKKKKNKKAAVNEGSPKSGKKKKSKSHAKSET